MESAGFSASVNDRWGQVTALQYLRIFFATMDISGILRIFSAQPNVNKTFDQNKEIFSQHNQMLIRLSIK
jgi:hypothetical protein